jgi:SAM-dependent methyltransferase
MNSFRLLGHNLKYLFSRSFTEQEQSLSEQLGAFTGSNSERQSAYEKALGERLSHYDQALDERAQAYEQQMKRHLESYEAALDTRTQAYEQQLKNHFDEFEAALNQRWQERLGALDERLDQREQIVDQRLDQREQAVDQRLDGFETATTTRVTDFETAISQRLDTHEAALDSRLAERDLAVDQRLEARELALDQRLDERFTQIETRLDERAAALEKHVDERTDHLETHLDQGLDERFVALELRGDERLTALELRGDERFASLDQHNEKRLEELLRTYETRFDERARAAEALAEQRMDNLERRADERFVRLEKNTDIRMETHERRVDAKLKANRDDLVDRTDVMLQLFEQRLDQQRRALRALHATQPALTDAADSITPLPELKEVLQESVPTAQIQSFRKLAEGYHPPAASKLPKAETALYHRILAWKKVAHEGLNDFTPDEQEVVDYILSFISDPAERHYTMQHMRRFLATLERIPPPQSSADRLLELGSLLHFVPALKKFTGYQIFGADFWEGEENASVETLKQVKGKAEHQVELRNFNVETDPFPYPDKHFRVVLCCELIEHLQRDPLHMLWECNRVLQDDGFLLLTTPNIASARSIEGLLITCSPYLLSQYNRTTPVDQHNHEYAPYEVGVALAAAGFTVVALEAEDVWLRSNPAILELLQQVEISTDLRGDNLFALARKAAAPVERYPKELYVQ